MTFSGEIFFPSKVPEFLHCAFQLSSTTPVFFFYLVCSLFLRKTKTKYSNVHNDHNKTEQEHFCQKNDAGECFSTKLKSTCKNSGTFEGKKISPEKVTYIPLAPSHSIV